MPPRDDATRIHDMLLASRKAIAILDGRPREDFLLDEVRQLAVVDGTAFRVEGAFTAIERPGRGGWAGRSS